jgi:bifunctional non-homologous end joining protein LigD
MDRRMPPPKPKPWSEDPASVRPMLATLHDGPADDLLDNPRWVFEPKLDGMRILALVEAGDITSNVRLWTRNGREKTSQFPDVVKDLKRFARTLRRSVLVDGEVVAVDARGRPQSFQRLAARIHLSGDRAIAAEAQRRPVAFVVFDVLRDGADDLRPLTLVQRRARLEKIIGNAGSEIVRFGEQSAGGEGRRWLDAAAREQWEGLIAKDSESVYVSARRSPAWRKLKFPCHQDFVVGGWTEPRGSRTHFGSLLVGYYEGEGRARRLVYAGSVGSGFDDKELERLWKLLRPLAVDRCPFASRPSPLGEPRWARPELVVDARFTEWTDEGLMRHPVYLGLRAGKPPGDVVREAEPQRIALTMARSKPAREGKPGPAKTIKRKRSRGLVIDTAHASLVEQLEALERARRDGTVTLPGGARLEVTNLTKVFWPGPHVTKGELLRYYARISPWLLPAVADRPLIMKRFPNGISAKTFYQQRAPDEVPPGVRVELVEEADEPMPRLVGGSLLTLLYMTQLAAISQDPWFSRVQSRHFADYAALDLDPMTGVPFTQVRDVARYVGEELATLDVVAVPKTSGSSGIHVYIPLAPDTPYAAGQLFCQIIATMVATRHPRLATIERTVSRRGRTVYVDYLQNIEGKSLATAYSARASEFAGVSTPLAWGELDGDVHPEDFTIRSVFARFEEVGDLWAPMSRTRRTNLRTALEKLAARR